MDTSILAEQQTTSIPGILQNLIFQENLSLKLNALDTCLHAIDENVAQKIGATKIRASLHQKYLDNIDFMRKLKLYSKMLENTETALELMGSDYLTHPEFVFDAEFETILSGLNKELNRLIGQMLKEYGKGDEYEY